MRTLDELVKFIKEAEALYTAKEESSNREREEALKLKKEAKLAADYALALGDQRGYNEALEAERYNTERSRVLYFSTVEPYFTKEENNAFVAEVHAAEAAETSPLYERLVELMDEWCEIVDKLNSIYRKRSACGRYLCGTRAKKNKFPDNYNDTDTMSMVPRCLDLFKKSGSERTAIDQLRKSARFYGNNFSHM